jgi:hypothetical protein
MSLHDDTSPCSLKELLGKIDNRNTVLPETQDDFLAQRVINGSSLMARGIEPPTRGFQSAACQLRAAFAWNHGLNT